MTTAQNVICIGRPGQNVNNTCFIGNIFAVTTGIADAINVVVDSHGQLGTMSSSRRFKNEIKPMDKASEATLRAQAGQLPLQAGDDATQTLAFGLIAEEVAKVNPDLVVRDAEGKP